MYNSAQKKNKLKRHFQYNILCEKEHRIPNPCRICTTFHRSEELRLRKIFVEYRVENILIYL